MPDEEQCSWTGTTTEDGIWCRKDVRGRLYLVNGVGQRCAKPKTFEKSTSHYSDQNRLAEMSPHVWWNIKGEWLQWWVDHFGGALAVSMKRDFTCNPIGVSSLVSKATGSLVQTWNRYFHLSDSATDVGCYSEGESDDDFVISEREEMPLPWDDWETFVAELGEPGVSPSASCHSPQQVPGLLRRTSDDAYGHRDKLGTSLYPDNLCVARPVGKAEIEKTPAAKAATKKEWDRLRSKYVWDEDHPREWDDVRAEARRGGVYSTSRISFLGICVEKSFELAEHLRKYKGRVVFQGNQVYDQNYNYAIFRIWAALLQRFRRLRLSISSAAFRVTPSRSLTRSRPTFKRR